MAWSTLDYLRNIPRGSVTCLICMDPVGVDAVRLSCHPDVLYCSDCMSRWLGSLNASRTRPTCPTCRRIVNTDNLRVLHNTEAESDPDPSDTDGFRMVELVQEGNHLTLHVHNYDPAEGFNLEYALDGEYHIQSGTPSPDPDDGPWNPAQDEIEGAGRSAGSGVTPPQAQAAPAQVASGPREPQQYDWGGERSAAHMTAMWTTADGQDPFLPPMPGRSPSMLALSNPLVPDQDQVMGATSSNEQGPSRVGSGKTKAGCRGAPSEDEGYSTSSSPPKK